MKKGNSSPLPPELQKEIEAPEANPDRVIDTSDMPEITDWTDARRGLVYRPLKTMLSLRIDADVVGWFKSRGENGYQTRINAALREHMLRHQHD
ncbi:MAG: BrnA antitoxin family protein [Alphaproteobacteria bacterium]|nr:BrnA antitoxin family protein [Alphaproteobacteria bacterium]